MFQLKTNLRQKMLRTKTKLATDFILSIILHSYNKVLRRGRWTELVITVKLILFTWAISLGCLYMAHIVARYSRVVMGIAAVVHLVLTYTTRLLWKMVVRKINSRWDANTLLIVASREEASDVVKQIKNDKFNYDKIVGIATFEVPLPGEKVEELEVISSADNIIEYVQRHWVDEVLIAVTPGTGLPVEPV